MRLLTKKEVETGRYSEATEKLRELDKLELALKEKKKIVKTLDNQLPLEKASLAKEFSDFKTRIIIQKEQLLQELDNLKREREIEEIRKTRLLALEKTLTNKETEFTNWQSSLRTREQQIQKNEDDWQKNRQSLIESSAKLTNEQEHLTKQSSEVMALMSNLEKEQSNFNQKELQFEKWRQEEETRLAVKEKDLDQQKTAYLTFKNELLAEWGRSEKKSLSLKSEFEDINSERIGLDKYKEAMALEINSAQQALASQWQVFNSRSNDLVNQEFKLKAWEDNLSKTIIENQALKEALQSKQQEMNNWLEQKMTEIASQEKANNDVKQSYEQLKKEVDGQWQLIENARLKLNDERLTLDAAWQELRSKSAS